MKTFRIGIILLLISFCSFSQQLLQKTYEGNINGKIPVSVTLKKEGNSLFGNVTYKKKGLPIAVIGYSENNTVFFNELMPDGKVTGTFSGEIKGDLITGKWFSPEKNARELSFSIRKISEKAVNHKTIKDVTGIYNYSFGEEGGSGDLRVKRLRNDKIAISFDCIRGAPSYNMATISKTTVRLNGNKAIYSSNEFGKCRFFILFSENGARVSFFDNAYSCGFGNAATVEGNYIKTNSSIPKFEENNH